MSIPVEAYQALQSIVGPEWVDDDPMVTRAEVRGRGMGERGAPKPPACIVIPETGDQVQAIIKLCNRYMLPFTATVTNPPPGRDRDNVVYLDLRRMRKYEIDEDNLFATVEPGVSFTGLQAELFKRGLMTFCPGSGGNCSVVANTLNIGEGPLSYKLGDRGYRRVLAVEWITCDGEKVMVGSPSTTKEFFAGDGPGPDLRSLLANGAMAAPSSKGIITRMSVRIFPFISEEMVAEGDAPTTMLVLPGNRFRWYNCIFPSRQAAVDALYEIARCGIGLASMTMPPYFFAMARARAAAAEAKTGAAGVWENWNNVQLPRIRENPDSTTLRILLYGIGSNKRLAYEEKVLLNICEEYKASARASRRTTDETQFMSADAIVSNVGGGRFTSIIFFESMDHGLKSSKIVYEISKKYTPPLIEDYGTTGWVVGYEMCHCCKNENLRVGPIEAAERLNNYGRECQEAHLVNGGFPDHAQPRIFGAAWGNFPEKDRMFKKVMDPNSLGPGGSGH